MYPILLKSKTPSPYNSPTNSGPYYLSEFTCYHPAFSTPLAQPMWAHSCSSSMGAHLYRMTFGLPIPFAWNILLSDTCVVNFLSNLSPNLTLSVRLIQIYLIPHFPCCTYLLMYQLSLHPPPPTVRREVFV